SRSRGRTPRRRGSRPRRAVAASSPARRPRRRTDPGSRGAPRHRSDDGRARTCRRADEPSRLGDRPSGAAVGGGPSAPRSGFPRPGEAARSLAGELRTGLEEAGRDHPVADLEPAAPAAGLPLRVAGPPRTILVLAVAGALAHDGVGAGEDPVEVRIVVRDALQRPPDVAEHLADLLFAVGQTPLREVHLRVVGEQRQDAVPGRRDAAVVEGLQVLERHRLALLVGHRLLAERHACSFRCVPDPYGARARRYSWTSSISVPKLPFGCMKATVVPRLPGR